MCLSTFFTWSVLLAFPRLVLVCVCVFVFFVQSQKETESNRGGTHSAVVMVSSPFACFSHMLRRLSLVPSCCFWQESFQLRTEVESFIVRLAWVSQCTCRSNVFKHCNAIGAKMICFWSPGCQHSCGHSGCPHLWNRHSDRVILYTVL